MKQSILTDINFETTASPNLNLILKKNDILTSGHASTTVDSVLQSKVTSATIDDQDAFYVCDLGEVERQYSQWKTLLPRVRPFYAVKCNPNLMVLQTLAKCGAGFDCASKAEVKAALDAGVSPDEIIYANPCKQASHIKFACENKVNVMTFDNADELYKIKAVNPNARMVLRILTDDSKSLCRFGVKFGASLAIVPYLLETARSLDLQVIGISFHVGSGCYSAESFTDAVILARKAFDIGAALGFNFKLLDIGGGFPGNRPEGLQFKDIAKILGPCIDELFPPSVEVISEPGRYFVSSAFTLATNIIARRVTPRDSETQSSTSGNDHPSFMCKKDFILDYVNDGMYGSFNCIAFDHAVVKAVPLCKSGTFITPQHSLQEFSSSVWGPTCDSIDLISKDCFLPEMQVGDWLRFNFMGAYTMAAASNLYYFINLAMASPRVRSFTSIHFPTNGSNPE